MKNATSNLKRAIELKNSIQAILKRFEDLGVNLDDIKPKNKNEKKIKSIEASYSVDDAVMEVDSDKPTTCKCLFMS